MIIASVSDRPAIEAFLARHQATSMFPLSNLRNHGMSGGHPRACTFYFAKDAGEITDVVTITDEGIVFPQCPNGNWQAAAKALSGQAVKGCLGAADQIAGLRSAIRLTHKAQLDVVEPFYQLQLDALVMPQSRDYKLVSLLEVSRALLHDWRAAYATESLAIPGEDAMAQAERDIKSYIAADSHRVLLSDDTPVAMTGFNAMLPEIVQIGGVYTPPALRSRGYARAAIALHLAQARTQGVKEAVLFAANPSAERAYEAVGFQRDGSFAIALYESPQNV
jgi:predicted GNAT family acetyltransferase